MINRDPLQQCTCTSFKHEIVDNIEKFYHLSQCLVEFHFFIRQNNCITKTVVLKKSKKTPKPKYARFIDLFSTEDYDE